MAASAPSRATLNHSTCSHPSPLQPHMAARRLLLLLHRHSFSFPALRTQLPTHFSSTPRPPRFSTAAEPVVLDDEEMAVPSPVPAPRSSTKSQPATAATKASIESQPAAATTKASSNGGSKYLIGKSEEELMKVAEEMGQQKYRGRQLHQLLYKNKAKDLQNFSLLPKEFRENLINSGWKVGRSDIHHTVTSSDGTMKVLLKLEDNKLVETVGIPVEERRGTNRLTVCVSSQVGCPLRCSFCATGKGGYGRNLKAHEIIEQVLLMEELFKHRVSNVVFMGMGEPMLNLPAVLAAHRTLNQDLQIGQRMITISTVGVPNTITRLASQKLQSTLAISLHAPNQQLREQIVPSAKAYPLEALMADCKNYFQITGRRVSFEYTLLAGVNDGQEHATELTELLHHWRLGHHVNLIPYNPVSDSDFRRPFKASIMKFVEILNNRGVTASVRQTRGLDANAACGQLRNDFQKIPLSTI